MSSAASRMYDGFFQHNFIRLDIKSPSLSGEICWNACSFLRQEFSPCLNADPFRLNDFILSLEIDLINDSSHLHSFLHYDHHPLPEVLTDWSVTGNHWSQAFFIIVKPEIFMQSLSHKIAVVTEAKNSYSWRLVRIKLLSERNRNDQLIPADPREPFVCEQIPLFFTNRHQA